MTEKYLNKSRSQQRGEKSAPPLYIEGIKSIIEKQGLSLYEADTLLKDFYHKHDKSHLRHHVRAVRQLRREGMAYENYGDLGKQLFETPYYSLAIQQYIKEHNVTIEQAYLHFRQQMSGKGYSPNSKTMRLARETALFLICLRDKDRRFKLVEFDLTGSGNQRVLIQNSSRKGQFIHFPVIKAK